MNGITEVESSIRRINETHYIRIPPSVRDWLGLTKKHKNTKIKIKPTQDNETKSLIIEVV